jgi:hypothetical protein
MTMRRLAARGSIALVLAATATGCAGKPARVDSASVSASVGDAPDTGSTSGGDTIPTAEVPSGRPSNALSIRPAPGADTLRGIIRVIGGSIDASPMLRPNGGGPQVPLLGDQAAALGRLSGTDVWVSGKRDGTRGLHVDRFLVRSVDGVPAIDGTVIDRDGGVAIVTTADHAEHPIVNPPSALRARVGARVWVTGALETGAVTFGVISER